MQEAVSTVLTGSEAGFLWGYASRTQAADSSEKIGEQNTSRSAGENACRRKEPGWLEEPRPHLLALYLAARAGSLQTSKANNWVNLRLGCLRAKLTWQGLAPVKSKE